MRFPLLQNVLFQENIIQIHNRHLTSSPCRLGLIKIFGNKILLKNLWNLLENYTWNSWLGFNDLKPTLRPTSRN